MYHLSSRLLTHFINIYVASYFFPYIVLLDLCTVVFNYIKNNNGTPHHLHCFCSIFTGATRDMAMYSINDIDSTYETEAPECSITTMEPTVSQVITTSPTDNHDLNKNLYPDSEDPDMGYFPEKGVF